MSKPLLRRIACAILLLLLAHTTIQSQTLNDAIKVDASNNVGIGVAAPSARLHVAGNGRSYYVNRAIPGETEDGTGEDYLLLHPAYAGGLMYDYFVMGKITGIRGGTGAWNRKWTVEVNTATAYSTDRGSIISYNEGADLVTVTYNGTLYLAVRISNLSTMYYFSFTGYAQNETLQLVKQNDVTNVQPFKATDPITIQGKVGIGTTNPAAKLDIGVAYNEKTAVLARQAEGNDSGDGTYLGIRAGTTQPVDALSFSIEHKFYGLLNNSINFYRGGANTGGFMAFSTNDGTEKMRLDAGGNVGIGVLDTKGYKLAVNGPAIFTKAVVKAQANWPDYVFDSAYQLPSLDSVQQYIHQNKHLPEVPSADSVQATGVDLAANQAVLLKKIEELTLYMIDLKKAYDQVKQENAALKKEVEIIKKPIQ